MAGSFGSACASVFTHQRIRQLLPEYLIRTHCIIRTTVPLMESVRVKALEMSDTDPVAAGVARYLTKHVEEELDHDLWLL